MKPAILLCFISACSWAGRTGYGIPWTTPKGQCGKAQDPLQCAEDITQAVDRVAIVFQQVTGRHVPPDIYQKIVRITLESERPDCSDEDGPRRDCHGVAFHEGGKWDIHLKAEECLVLTSLAHELIHVFGYETGMGPDSEHKIYDMFLWRGNKSVEYLSFKALIESGLCNQNGEIWMVGE